MLQDFLDTRDGIACAVDAESRIVAVGRRRWDRFAVENGAPDLCADNIIGRDLFEFLSGPELRRAYRHLADRILAAGEPVVIAVCCDGPGIAREIRLSLAPLPLAEKGAGLLLQAQIVGEAAAPPDIFDLETLLSALVREADQPIATICSFCRKFRWPGSGDGEEWVTAETYRQRGGDRVRISHGICPDCDAARFPGP